MNPSEEARCMYELRVLAEKYGAKAEFEMNSEGGMDVEFVWPEDIPLQTKIDVAEKADKIVEGFGGKGV